MFFVLKQHNKTRFLLKKIFRHYFFCFILLFLFYSNKHIRPIVISVILTFQLL